MKIPFISKRQKNNIAENEILLALDVGTEYIKSAIFQIVDNKVEIIGYAREKQQSNSMYSAMIVNLDNVINSTDICIGKALAVADKTLNRQVEIPKKAIVGIAGELVKGVTITVDYDRENPDKKITQKELDEVLDTVKSELSLKIHQDIAEEMGLITNQVEEVDTKIVGSKLDGIKLDNPIGFTGAKAEISVYSIYSPKIHINSLRELVSRLGLEILDIVVEPYAIARSVKNSHKDSFSGIFIDIGGGTTDIAIVKNGVVMGTKMFAFGGKVFTKRLMHDFKIDMQEAEQLKLDYTAQKLSDVKMKKVKESFGKDISIWTEGVELALEEFEDIDIYPDQMFFCGGGSHLPEIKSGLVSYPWLQVLEFKRFPRMSYIYPNQLDRIIDKTKLMIDPIDVAPGALSLMALD